MDIRMPIGVLFVALGLILVVFGLFSGPDIYRAHSLGLNVNLAWGAAMAAFGLGMTGFALRARRRKMRAEGGCSR
jgi:hypothetical protein